MALHLWHQMPVGPNTPDTIYAIIEVPKGNRNKYEYDKDLGTIRLDRVLYSSLHYPGDYGFIPKTFFEDGDPLDILVMMNEPTFPGCIVEARPIGMFKMIDKGEPDYKILAVPTGDPNFKDMYDLPDIPQHFPNEVGHFFMRYKELEGTNVHNEGWVGAEDAKRTILESAQLYDMTYGDKFQMPLP